MNQLSRRITNSLFSLECLLCLNLIKNKKIEIYHKWKDENISISQLAKAYRMNLANLDYMLRLIDMHGIEILTTKNQSYSKEIQKLKEENLRLRIVNEYVKKLSALDQEDQKK